MSIPLKQVLNKLEEGNRLTLRFPSVKEREGFRVAMYKAKRDIDEILLMTDMDYEPDMLKFEKHDHDLEESGGWTATIYLIKKADLPRRGYDFEIIEDKYEQRPATDPA